MAPRSLDKGKRAKVVHVSVGADLHEWLMETAKAADGGLGRSVSAVVRIILQAEKDKRETIAREIARVEEER